MIKYYFKGSKTTRKFLESVFGVTKVATRIKEARDEWGRDPYKKCVWVDGMCLVNGNFA